MNRELLDSISAPGTPAFTLPIFRIHGSSFFARLFMRSLRCSGSDPAVWARIDEGKKLSCKLLDSKSSFVLDCGDEVHVWNGRFASEEVRRSAEDFATVSSSPAGKMDAVFLRVSCCSCISHLLLTIQAPQKRHHFTNALGTAGRDRHTTNPVVCTRLSQGLECHQAQHAKLCRYRGSHRLFKDTLLPTSTEPTGAAFRRSPAAVVGETELRR